MMMLQASLAFVSHANANQFSPTSCPQTKLCDTLTVELCLTPNTVQLTWIGVSESMLTGEQQANSS